MKLRGFTAIAIVLTLSGCVSKSTHEGVVAQLAECREDKTAAQRATDACENRFEREVSRWEAMDATVGTVVPAALQQLETDRERILELVPTQVQEEVAGYMDELSAAVDRGFRRLQGDNERMVSELAAAQDELARLGVSTDTLGTRVDTLRGALEEQAILRQQAAEIAARLREFDQTMVNCQDCEERLRLNRRERETISNFHAEVLGQLTELATGGSDHGSEEAAAAPEGGSPGEASR